MINLWHRYGSRFRVTCEQSCDRKHHNPQCDPAYAILLCEHGHIYIHSDEQLGAATARRGPVANALATVARVTQSGDDGINAIFRPADFDQVAAIMKPRRKRQQRPGSADHLRMYRFVPATQAAGNGAVRVPQPQGD